MCQSKQSQFPHQVMIRIPAYDAAWSCGRYPAQALDLEIAMGNMDDEEILLIYELVEIKQAVVRTTKELLPYHVISPE